MHEQGFLNIAIQESVPTSSHTLNIVTALSLQTCIIVASAKEYTISEPQHVSRMLMRNKQKAAVS